MANLTSVFKWGFFPVLLSVSVVLAERLMSNGVSEATVTLVIPAIIMLVVAISERILPFNRDWNTSRKDILADFSSFILVAGVLESVLKLVAPALIAILIIQNTDQFALFPNAWPIYAQLIVFTLSADLAKYWFHRWGHETNTGWKLHSIHHAVKRVYWFNGFRIHPLYHAINFFTAIFPLLVFGASSEVVALYTIVLSVAAAIQHANIDLKFGFLNYIFNTNEVHRWHHSKDVSEGNNNYGAVVMVWDVLFGTYFNKPDEQPAVIGIEQEDTYPMNNYFKQLLVPFFWGKIALNKNDNAEQRVGNDATSAQTPTESLR